MNSIVVRGYECIDAGNLGRRHQEPFVIIAGISDHVNGHYVKPNSLALKYLDFKKNVDPDVHVKVFNSIVRLMQKPFKSIISMRLTIH
jgi:hypothetical protein